MHPEVLYRWTKFKIYADKTIKHSKMATTLKYSYISGKPIQASEIVSGSEIRESIFDLIREDFPAFRTDDVISIYELNKYRRLYLTRLVE